ncbi:MAG: hypothetical protein L6Q35_07985, partial [Phycisphaerales bacterium]|nr:hypothetical protein [Phycisphaerales bacterium]
TAVLHGRQYVIPEDITSNVEAVCAHRIVLRSVTPGRPDAAAAALRSVLQSVPNPA